MAWVAIPQSLGDDPRLDALGDAGVAAIVRLYCYCGEHETDGRLSIARAERLAPREILTALVGLGLLVRDDAGYLIQDFLVHNLSHEARDHAREKARERKAAWMERRSERRSEREEERRPERCKTGTGTGTGMGMERTVPDKPPSEACESAPPPRDVPRETVPAKLPKAPKPKRPPHPMRQVYLDEFHQAHKTATGGSVYTWDGRALAALDRACETYPLDRWRAACAGYARRLPEWLFRDGSAPDLQGMIRSFNAFAAAACGPPPDRPAGPNGRLSIEQILAYKRPTNGQ